MGSITFRFEETDKQDKTFEIFEGESILEVALDNNICDVYTEDDSTIIQSQFQSVYYHNLVILYTNMKMARNGLFLPKTAYFGQ